MFDLSKSKIIKSKKLRDSARGQECLVRSPVCNHNPETTVLAHRRGGGMGAKVSDIHAAFACSDCHDLIDSRTHKGYSPAAVQMWHDDAIFRTQQWWADNGYLEVK